MIIKPIKSLMIDIEFNNGNLNSNNVVAINHNLLFFLFLKIIKIKFKTKLQTFICSKIFKVLTKSWLLIFIHNLLEWNESKLSIFIKIYTIRSYF